MLFLIIIIRINMKEEFSFLITKIPLRPLRLCVINSKVIPLKSMILEGS